MVPAESLRLLRLLTWTLVSLAGALSVATCARAAGLSLSATLTAEAHGTVAARPNPSSICLGEVLEVQLNARHPSDPSARVSTAINGLTAERRFLQYLGEPGKHRIHLAARSEDGLLAQDTVTLQVDPCRVSGIPGLSHHQNPYHPYRTGFRLLGLDALGPDFTGYHWDFGDGTSTFSAESFVSHDYSAAMDGTAPYRSFLVQIATQPFVNGQAPAGSLVRRYTAAVGDTYYFSRQRGLLQPPVDHEPVLEHRGSQLVGSYSIRNLEPEHLVFQHLTRETFPCEPGRPTDRKVLLPSDVIFQGGLDLGDPGFAESPEYQLSLQIRDSMPWLPEDTQVVPPLYDPDHPPAYVGGKAVGGGGFLSRVTARGKGAASAIFPPIPPPTEPLSGFVVVPAGHTHRGYLSFDSTEFDPSHCTVAFHLVGETLSGLRAYASLYYELREHPQLSGEVRDQDFARFLDQVLARGWVADPTEVTDEDLYRLEQEGKARRTPAGWEVI